MTDDQRNKMKVKKGISVFEGMYKDTGFLCLAREDSSKVN